jgi:hypothetical protein
MKFILFIIEEDGRAFRDFLPVLEIDIVRKT